MHFLSLCVRACVCTGKTALHWAASMNMVGIMRVLQKHGANKDAQDNQVRPKDEAFTTQYP